MALHQTQKHKTAASQKSTHSIWGLAALFLVALAVVFAVSGTGKAATDQSQRYQSPPPSPIYTPTPTPTVSPLPSPTPVVEAVNPGSGVINRPNQINVYGNHFQSRAVVRIFWESHGQTARSADTPVYIQLDTQFIGPQHLVAKVPANIAKGLYGVRVINPDNQRSEIVHAAYEATSANPQDTNDLTSRAENLWTTPNALTAGESVSLGLTVFRTGGVGGLPPFAVDFYAGEVNATHKIGRGFITGISPDSSASTSAISWTPESHGEIKLFAVIDPDGQIAESNEQNNQIKRKVNVRYTQLTDTTPPLAQKLYVNGGEHQVSDPNVSLSVDAVDPAPNPTGVTKSYYVELQWASGIGSGGVWIPVKWTTWNDFASQPHAYEMMPNSGLRYLQAWVADGAGNISAKPAIQRVNYVPATDSLLEGEIRVFRPALLAGQCLSVRIEPADSTMDPDLYVWPPNHTPGNGPAGYSILPAGQVDQVIIQPTQAGIYQVEVVAFTDATYNQSIEILESCPTARTSLAPTTPNAKTPRTEPAVPVEDVPVGDETAPETIKQYLSFISLTSREIQSAGSNKTIYLPTLNR